MPAAGLPLRVEVQQLSGEVARGPAGSRLDRVPALRPQRGELRRAIAGADVARDLGQLVRWREDAVLTAVLQLQVVARDPGERLRVEPREPGDAVVLVDDEVAHAQIGEARQATAGRRRSRHPPAVDQPAEGVDGQLEVRRDKALQRLSLGKGQALRRASFQERGVQAIQAVAGALRLAAMLERDDDAVAGAQLALQERLCLADAARRGHGRLRAEHGNHCRRRARLRLPRRRVTGGPAQSQGCSGSQRLGHVHVEALGVLGVDRGRHVLPVVVERPLDLRGVGDDDRGLGGNQVEDGAEALQRQQLGDVRTLPVLHRDLGQLAVLQRQLRGRRELDPVAVTERALGEGGEPADRLDLVAEELQAGGPFLGGGEDVEDPAAQGELATLLHLVGALVSGLDEELGDLPEIDLLANRQGEPPGAQGGVGHRLGQRHRAGNHHRGLDPALPSGERIERGDAQPDEVRRWCEVRLVAGAAGGVEPRPPGRQVRVQLAGEVAGSDVVGRHEERRAAGQAIVRLDERGEEVRRDRGRRLGANGLAAGEGPASSARQRAKPLVLVRYLKQWSQRHGTRKDRTARPADHTGL